MMVAGRNMIIPSIIAAVLCLAESSDWGYSGEHGPTHWKDLTDYETCGADSQSPIDLVDATLDRDMPAITLTNYDQIPDTMALTLKNNGHAVLVQLDGADMTISGGKLPATYKLRQFHFHWGGHDERGSEHTVNGKALPMEMHLVHYNTIYDTITDAVDKDEGLAVLGFFFDIIESDVAAMNVITDKLPNITYSGDEIELSTFELDNILPSTSSMKDFFRYSGSLTTPACHESVVWTVFDKHLKISQKQLEKFRAVYFNEKGQEDAPMEDNYRPVQHLNDRIITANFDSSAGGATRNTQCALGLLVAALTLAIGLRPQY